MHPRIRSVLIHSAATLGGVLIGVGAAWIARRWLLPAYFAASPQSTLNSDLAMILIYSFTSVPGAVLVSRFALRQPGDIGTAIFLGEFFGPLLGVSLGYLGIYAMLIPPLIGVSLLTLSARGPGNHSGWGANLINNLNQRQ